MSGVIRLINSKVRWADSHRSRTPWPAPLAVVNGSSGRSSRV